MTLDQPTRSRGSRVVLAVLAALQFLVAGVLPFSDTKTPSQIGAHVEQYGGRLHYVHDESLCLACVARHALGGVPRPTAELPLASAHVVLPPSEPVADPTAELHREASPRAPPAPARIA
jgi:hypothetical protein